ncbi:MAG: hypothetical protein M1839_005994 [Geoglossum umbratile]|nr:MAG: hypothetical protein M1839_005994 [Geoglossum umbratile]
MMRLRIGLNDERVFLTSPKAFAEVLVAKSYSFSKTPRLRSRTEDILGNGLLIAEGDEHRASQQHQRKNMLPTFAFRHIKDHYPTFWAKAYELNCYLEEDLRRRAPDNSCDITDWASRATLDVIGVTAMGHDFNSIRDPHTPLIETYRRVLRPNRASQIVWIIGFLPPKWLMKFLPFGGIDNIWEAAQVARQTSHELIRKKRIQPKGEKTPTRLDFISLALESGAFTDEELVSQTMTLLGAGHDTTAATFVWAIYALCLNLSVQTRLREEIRRDVPSDAVGVDSTLIDSLPYLRAVVNEVFRYHPTIPMTQRAATEDTTILGQYIRKGTVVVTSPSAVNYSRELWGDDADQFNPERWLCPGKANGGGAQNNYAFMSFSHGPRSCIGQGLAKSEISCFLAKFVGRFEFAMKDPNEKVEIQGPMTAKPKNGLNIVLKVVEGWS